MSRRFGFPKNFPSDHEIATLLSGEISRDNFTVRATEIIDTVGSILSDINLPVRIRDFVNDVQRFGYFPRTFDSIQSVGYGWPDGMQLCISNTSSNRPFTPRVLAGAFSD